MSETMPTAATLGTAADHGARALQGLLNKTRTDAIRDDGYFEGPERTIKGGGLSREHYAMAAAEWGSAYGYLRAVADAEKAR